MVQRPMPYLSCVCVCVYAVPSRLGVGIKEDIRRSPLVGLLTQNQERELCTSSHRALFLLMVMTVLVASRAADACYYYWLPSVDIVGFNICPHVPSSNN